MSLFTKLDRDLILDVVWQVFGIFTAANPVTDAVDTLSNVLFLVRHRYSVASLKCAEPCLFLCYCQQPAYQNLRQKVDNFVTSQLSTQDWNPSINKNQMRNGLRQSVVQ